LTHLKSTGFYIIKMYRALDQEAQWNWGNKPVGSFSPEMGCLDLVLCGLREEFKGTSEGATSSDPLVSIAAVSHFEPKFEGESLKCISIYISKRLSADLLL
jgi:hypothetical protein